MQYAPVQLLEAVGESCYGLDWQSPLARELGVVPRTVRRYVAGDRQPAAEIETRLRGMADRVREAASLHYGRWQRALDVANQLEHGNDDNE
jgi:predicted transcriptional regulator